MKIKQLLGNKMLLKLPKTAFLCSRKIPASAVLKCYDWAIEQREAGNCIISGFLILKTGKEIPVSVRKKARLIQILEDL